MIGRNLTAAAARIDRPRTKIRPEGKPWQERLWEIYRDLGAVHFGLGLKRHAAERISYFAAELVEDVDEPVPTEDQRVIEAVDRLGDVADIIGEFVIHENVAGEGYLVGRDRGGIETFDVWTPQEVNAARMPQKDGEQLTDEDLVVRVWRSAPYKHSEPDSPLRSVQEQCEQLLLLNRQIGAVAMSRLSAGILLVPSELSFGLDPTEPPDTGANADGDGFTGEIIEIVTTPITDTESAALVAPAVIRGASEYLEKIRRLDFAREVDKTFADMREELLRAIAGGIDMPAELITGVADLNHWSLWGVDESMAKLHVDPDVLHILAGLNQEYLWVALEEGGMSPIEARRFLIWRDYSDLTSRPITVDQAMDLRKLGTISDEYLRRVANVPDDGAGDGVPLNTSTGQDVTTNNEPPAITAAAGIYLDGLAQIDRTLAARIIEATEAAFGRALERAGVRIRNKAQKDRNLYSQLAMVHDRDLSRFLGKHRVDQFQLTTDQLIPPDTFDPLGERLRRLIDRANEDTRAELASTTGEDTSKSIKEDEDRDAAVAAFLAALFALAAARLFTPAPDPDPAETGEFSDEIAPAQLVYALLTQAGGGGPVESFTADTPRGLALGQRTRSFLTDKGYVDTSETWVYGDPSTRRTNFEPHRALHGQPYTPTPPPINALWLGVEFMFPGDHRGCLCQLVPTVEYQGG